MPLTSLRVNAERLYASVQALGEIGSYFHEQSGLRGVNRLALSPEDGADAPKLVFNYAGPNLDTNLRNLFASLAIPATLREVSSASKQQRSFVVVRKAVEPVSRPTKPAPAPNATPAGPQAKTLKERIPVSPRERERIENEWPAPKPAKAK